MLRNRPPSISANIPTGATHIQILADQILMLLPYTPKLATDTREISCLTTTNRLLTRHPACDNPLAFAS